MREIILKVLNEVACGNTGTCQINLQSEPPQRTFSNSNLHLLGNKSVGIGDHSTGDFYKNAEEALALLDNAESRLETLDKLIKEEI